MTTCRPRQIGAYNLVSDGMSKPAIRTLLGPPATRIVKASRDQYTFGQGEGEKEIKEGWIYGDPPGWGIEIYFDSSGRVVGKNQGQG